MEIQAIIQEQIGRIDFEGIIREEVEKSLSKLVKDKVDSLFKSYGDIGKQFEAHLDEKMKLDFSKVDLDQYHNFILDSIQKELAQYFTAKDFNMRDFVNVRLLSESRAEISLDEMEEEITEMLLDEFNIDREEYDSKYIDTISITVERDDDSRLSSSDFIKIKVHWDDPDGGESWRGTKKTGDFVYHLHNRKVYHMTGDIKQMRQWGHALKFRGTTITGL